MFRMRSMLSRSRLPLRLEAQRQQGQLHNVQKVGFLRRVRPRTVMVNMLVIYGMFLVYDRIVFSPLERLDLDSVEQLEDDEELEPPFLPFVGTTKMLKPVPYLASDPEWKGFVKFSKNKEEGQRARDELAAYVLKVATKHPVLSVRCGKEMKLRRSWLDIDFPSHAPAEFERSGLEFSGVTGVQWTTRKVDAATVSSIQSILWPSPIIQSFWAFTKVAVSDEVRRVAEMLGFQPSPPTPTMEQLLARHQRLQKQMTDPDKGLSSHPPAVSDRPNAVAPGHGVDKSALAGKEEQEIDMSVTKAGMDINAYFFRPILAFKMKLAQTWRPPVAHHPRGSITVSGLVEVDSPRAWLVFDVKAAYDPQERQYDEQSMHVALRRLQPKKQSPAGPPVVGGIPPVPPMAGRPY